MFIKIIFAVMLLTGAAQLAGAQTEEKTITRINLGTLSSGTHDQPNAEAAKFYDSGVEFAMKRELERAIADFNRAIELDPKYTDAYNRRGAAYSDSGQNALAIADFSQAIELDPDFYIAYLNRATAYTIAKKYRMALADYTKMIRLDPESQMNYLFRADVYEKLGRRDLAAADRRKARGLK